jgi:hypothetical protein
VDSVSARESDGPGPWPARACQRSLGPDSLANSSSSVRFKFVFFVKCTGRPARGCPARSHSQARAAGPAGGGQRRRAGTGGRDPLGRPPRPGPPAAGRAAGGGGGGAAAAAVGAAAARPGGFEALESAGSEWALIDRVVTATDRNVAGQAAVTTAPGSLTERAM